MTYGQIKITSRFKPRADAYQLSQLVQIAWREYREAMFPDSEQARVSEALAGCLEALHPAEDMAVLARYECTRAMTSVTVAAYDAGSPRPFEASFRVKLPREIIVGGREDTGLTACAPRASQDPCCGLKSSYWAQLTEQDRADIRRNCEDRERYYVPEDCNTYFASLLSVKKAYDAEYREVTAWPAEARKKLGEYPTWGEIANRFPVLGGYLRKHVWGAA
jgi:hypothetical protein